MIRANITKQLNPDGTTPCLDLNLEIETGSTLGVMGPSGAGKTTLLRILAGLTTPDSGSIISENDCWFDADRGINRPPQGRSVGFVFQNYALFPNMTARQNLEFAFAGNIEQNLLYNVIDMLDITSILDQKPDTLSGGEKQRVALGRALIRQPRLLLLDEPLSALDPEMRSKLRDYLHRVSINFHGTIILVSHDPAEIIQLTDRIVNINNGQISQSGPPAELLCRNSTSENPMRQGEILDIFSERAAIIVKTKFGVIKLPLRDKNPVNLSVGDSITFDFGKVEIHLNKRTKDTTI